MKAPSATPSPTLFLNASTTSTANTGAAIAAAVFAILVVVLFGKSMPEGAALGAFMFLLYIPLGYATDKMIFNFRMRKKSGNR